MTTIGIYIVIAMAGIVIAILLSYLAKLSTQGESRLNKRSSKLYATHDNKTLQQNILNKISPAIESEKDRQKVAGIINDIVDKELEQRVKATAQEINNKYAGMLEQKGKSEELAWEKYSKVSTEKQKTETIIRSITEGLIVVDSNGKVIMINPAAEKLLGVDKKEKIGKSITENIKDEQLLSLVKDSGKEGKDKEIELVSSRDETKKILRASSAVIENENGQTVGMVSMLTDVTKERELDHLKSSFVANVSHELRTPLVATDKAIALLLTKTTGQLTSEQEQFLQIAQRNLKRLGGLINDLLDLSKMEAKKMQLELQLASIETAINEGVAGLTAWANTKSISIETKISPNIPQFKLDSGKIIQVLNNLLSNAIKYTPAGGKISIEVTHDTESKLVKIIVQDTGVGIPKEDLAKIFDKFYQAKDRNFSDVQGTGLGLTIAREMIILHGGKIWAESEENKGTRFIFTLPVNT